MDKPYRKSSAREPQGIPQNYKDLSKTTPLTQEQVDTVLSATTIINNITSTIPDATTTTRGKVILAPNGGTAADTVVQANDTRLVVAQEGAIQFVFDGAGAALTAGMTVDIYCPWAFTILGATVLADQSGTAAFDVRADTYANYPPDGADSIVASAPPTITAAIKSKDTTLTGWSTGVAAGKTLQAYLTSTATVTRLTLTLEIRKT